MFSYRHAFHAGNHADVLKHLSLLATVRHLTQKDAALNVIDTHAGAGWYKFDSEAARTSGEAAGGVLKLLPSDFFEGYYQVVQESIEFVATNSVAKTAANASAKEPPPAAALADYLAVLRQFNPGNRLRTYPGSPFLLRHALRQQDRMTLFELHPTDARGLQKAVDEAMAEQPHGANIQLKQADGFEGLPKLLPPPPSDARGSRRALVLIDPSYELKTDYARTEAAVAAALKKFPTGCYAVWYPIIPRPEAHGLPRKLKTLATQAGKPWLQATLNVGRAEKTGPQEHKGLSASGMFIINPPHTLKAALQAALPKVKAALEVGRGAAWAVEVGG